MGTHTSVFNNQDEPFLPSAMWQISCLDFSERRVETPLIAVWTSNRLSDKLRWAEREVHMWKHVEFWDDSENAVILKVKVDKFLLWRSGPPQEVAELNGNNQQT